MDEHVCHWRRFFQDDVMLFNVIKLRKYTNEAIRIHSSFRRRMGMNILRTFYFDYRDKLAYKYFCGLPQCTVKTFSYLRSSDTHSAWIAIPSSHSTGEDSHICLNYRKGWIFHWIPFLVSHLVETFYVPFRLTIHDISNGKHVALSCLL